MIRNRKECDSDSVRDNCDSLDSRSLGSIPRPRRRPQKNSRRQQRNLASEAETEVALDHYEGQSKEGKAHGRGKMIFAGGDVYVGDFFQGKAQGEGEYTDTNGNVYTGAFEGGMRNGWGTHKCKRGGTYVGEWKNDKRNGEGTFTTQSGAIFTGQWKDDEKCGHGKTIYANRDEHEGLYKDGKRHGEGIYTYVERYQFKGEWEQGKRERRGTLTYPNGDVYVGDVCDVYVGKVKGLEPSGKGRITFKTGDVLSYDGEWKDGMRHGVGKMVWRNGNEYEGGWKDGMRHGVGKMVGRNEHEYKGGWREGKQHGDGIYTFPDGEQKGEWKDGTFQTTQEVDESDSDSVEFVGVRTAEEVVDENVKVAKANGEVIEID